MNVKTIEGNNKEGKNILIISGVHGDEITPIYCTRLIQDYLNATKFNVNTITILSAVNKKGIKNNSRDIIEKYSNDLNRSFSSEEQEDYVSILKSHIDKNDVIIDVHSSPKCTEFLLINQDFNANSYVEFCIKNNIKYFLRYSSSDTIKKYCNELGKISFTLELNGMNSCDIQSAIKGERIVNNILHNINDFSIIKSEPKYSTGTEIYSLYSGLVLYNINFGSKIEYNQLFNTIMNIDTFEEYYNSFDTKGKKYYPICYNGNDYIEAGSVIASIQEIQEIL